MVNASGWPIHLHWRYVILIYNANLNLILDQFENEYLLHFNTLSYAAQSID